MYGGIASPDVCAARMDADQSSAYVKSNGEWTARCVLMGFFIAPIEALPEITVTDVVSAISIIQADSTITSVLRGRHWDQRTASRQLSREPGDTVPRFCSIIHIPQYVSPP